MQNNRYSIVKHLCSLFLFFNVFVLFMQAQQQGSNLVLTLYFEQKKQTIQNIGTSACWFAEPIGRNFPIEKKEAMACLLFSRDTFPDGSPRGIGISCFRFNIGSGSAEPDSLGGIANPWHRVECFSDSNGNYDWGKQAGYQWFLRKAKIYGVEDLVAFINSPPSFMNQNGYTFKTSDNKHSNLRIDKYQAFADFAANVIDHFDREGLHFSYLSPVNEPQWGWNYMPSKAKQEGSPWYNSEIANVTRALDRAFIKKKLDTKILLPEAAMLVFLSGDSGHAAKQIRTFLDPSQADYLGNLSSLAPYIAGHSYFTDYSNQQIVNARRAVRDTLRACNPKFTYWQSEYCMLGDGFKEGQAQRTQFDAALFLAKIIHNDLAVGDATAWHYWNAFEPVNDLKAVARYFLVGIKPNKTWSDAAYYASKNLYILGHYSRFIRPGMQRIAIDRSDMFDDEQAAQDVMASAYIGDKGELILVLLNYSDSTKQVELNFSGFPQIFQLKSFRPYVTTVDENVNLQARPWILNKLILPARSIVTLSNKPWAIKEPINAEK